MRGKSRKYICYGIAVLLIVTTINLSPAIEQKAEAAYAPAHWTSKAFPGKPNIDLWGWHQTATYQQEPVNKATTSYVNSNIIDEASRWGSNFLNVYPTNELISNLAVPFEYTAGDPIPKSWNTYSDPNWNTSAYKDLITYAHNKGMSLDVFTHIKNFTTDANWFEWIFREAGNTLMNGIKNSWDGFEEERYPDNDGCIFTERATRYNPAAFTANSAIGETDIPNVPPPNFAVAIEAANSGLTDGMCRGLTDQPIRSASNGWLGGTQYQITSSRPYIANQADTRFFKPRKATWGTWASYGGGVFADWIMKQANDFSRRRLYKGNNCNTALWWINEATSVTPAYMRDFIYGVSQDPVKTAIATRLISSGDGGVFDSISAGKNSYPDRWDTAISQNNYTRISRYHYSDSGKLMYDRDIAAHYDSHSNAESTTNNIVLTSNVYSSELPNLAIPAPADPPRTVGSFDGSYAEFSSSSFSDAVAFDMETQSAEQFPGLLSEEYFPSQVTISFNATPGYYKFKLRTVSGKLYCYAMLDGDSSANNVIGYLNGSNDVYFSILNPGTHTLKLWCTTNTSAYVDAFEISKMSNVPILHSFEEEAGYISVLKEEVKKITSTRTLSETRRYKVVSDTPYQTLEIQRSFNTGSDTVNSVLGCEGYNNLIADGTTYTANQTFTGTIPTTLRLVDTTGTKPELVIFAQNIGNASSLTWTAGASLKFTSTVGTSVENQKFQFVVPEGIYTSTDYAALKTAINTLYDTVTFGAGSTVTVSNTHSIPLVKVVKVTDPTGEPYYVKEKGYGQSDFWWMSRGAQVGSDNDDYIRVYLQANGSAVIQKGGHGYINAKVKPGWGCQNIMAVKDGATSATATVEVLEVSPYIIPPKVMFNTSFDTVTINGADWRYFDENVVCLPNQKGTYTITVSTSGVEKPRINACGMNVTECSWDAANERIKLTGSHPGWFTTSWPSALHYKAAVITEGKHVSALDNGGGAAPDSDYRMFADDFNAMMTRGRFVNLNTGTTYITFSDVAQDFPVDENFNSGTTGQAPGGWTVGDATLVTVQDVPSAADKSMYMNNTSGFSGNLAATKTFTSQPSGIITETVRFRLGQLNTNVALGYLQDSSGTSATSVFFDGAAQRMRYVTGGETYVDLPGGTGLAANTWYDLKVVADKNNNTYDIYFMDMVNPKVTGAAFRNNVSISRVLCTVNDAGGSNVSAYFDNIRIINTPPLTAENFNSGTAGQVPGGWTVGDATLVTVQDVPSAADKSMYMNNTSGFSGNLTAAKTFSSQSSGIITGTLRFRLSQLNTNVALGYLQDSSGTSATSVFFDGAAQRLKYVTSGETYVDLPGGTGLAANTWYDLKVVANKSNNTYDIYFIDMVNPKVTGATFRNNVPISRVLCTVNDAGGSDVSAYVDNINITNQ